MVPATYIDIYGGWLGLDIDAIICRAKVIDALPTTPPSDVAAYKRLLNRPKARVHLELIETYFAAQRS